MNSGRKYVVVGMASMSYIRRIIIGSLASFVICTIPLIANATVQRPVVVVPGMLGSKLCTANGEVVWGNGSSLSNLVRLQLNSDSPETLVPCGLIDKIEVLGPIYSIKAYKALLDHLKEMGFDGSNLHLFDYDWRQSNFDIAQKLKTFIEERRNDGRIPGQFDIIAHSMGGTVTRVFLSENPSAPVNKVIYFGTPFLGSASTLSTLSEGWGSFANWLAGGMDKIREVVTSFPAFVEALPRYDRCCYIRKTGNSRLDIDVFDADQWKALNWLPSRVASSSTLFALFKTNLNRAKTLTAILVANPPNVTEIKFVGDAQSTRVYFAVREGATHPSSNTWFFTKDQGDGTVPVWSAARNPTFNSLAGTLVSFSEHVTLFDDRWAEDELEHELLAVTPVTREPIFGRGHPIISSTAEGGQRNWTIRFIELAAKQSTYRPNEILEANAVVTLDGGTEGLKIGLVKPIAVLRTNTAAYPIMLSETTSSDDLAERHLSFKLQLNLAALQAGAAEIEFSLPTVRDDAKAIARIAVVAD
jgi:pimeloyl-ACP methyl ester carboxylesterase